MSGRLWYPQLDIYDAVRRIAGLMLFWQSAAMPSQERLYIADFYLANPPLLHKTHMAADVRKEFNTLGVQRPEKTFLSYPSAPLLFQKMEAVQRQALQTLTGKGLIEVAALARGVVTPSEAGTALFEDQFSPLFDSDERRLGQFIANSFAQGEDIDALRRSTGLRRIAR
jgi:hypothetical protein